MNKIEEQFFETFGIEPFIYCSKPRLDCDARSKGSCRKDCEYYSGVLYPQITDRILLELICIHNTYLEANLYSLDYESLKKEILKDLINEQELRKLKEDYVSDDMEHQVRTLFEETENE